MLAPPLPLFGPYAAPPAAKSLAGWTHGDLCLLHDPKNPGHWRKARVLAVSLRPHLVTLRASNPDTPDSIVQVNPITHGHMLRRPPCCAPPHEAAT